MSTPTTWLIESSHMIAVPHSIDATSMHDLRLQVQCIADSKRVTRDSPAIGQLSYRYDLDEKNESAVVVRAYFTNKHGHSSRFMRLRRREL